MHFVVLGLTQQGDRLVLSEVSAPWAQDRATVAAALRAALAVMEAPQEAPAVPATVQEAGKGDHHPSAQRRGLPWARKRG